MRRMAILGAVAPLVLVLACGSRYSEDDTPKDLEGGADTGPAPDGFIEGAAPDAGDGSVLPECTAQRVVNIVAGNGSLAWFTQVWPIPDVITAYTPMFAYDDPTKAALIAGTKAGHPLYARKIGTRPLWQGISPRPDPSAFVFGTNEVHTQVPTSFQANGIDILALGASLQSALGAPVAALAFSPASYGTAPGAPALTSVTLVDEAIKAIKAKRSLTAAEESDLRPSPSIVASWVGPSPTDLRRRMAEQLLFAANAFRLGLVSMLLMPGTNDDPHGAFGGGDAPVGADTLTRTLDGFYTELAKSFETTCGHAGKPLSLADNVILVVNGDTYKNPFQSQPWADGTPVNSSLLYVRSNGFLEPGWFGRIGSDGSRTNFNPSTGALSSDATVAESTRAAQIGLLYAITRGNKSVVDTVANGAPYAGVIKTGM